MQGIAKLLNHRNLKGRLPIDILTESSRSFVDKTAILPVRNGVIVMTRNFYRGASLDKIDANTNIIHCDTTTPPPTPTPPLKLDYKFLYLS